MEGKIIVVKRVKSQIDKMTKELQSSPKDQYLRCKFPH